MRSIRVRLALIFSAITLTAIFGIYLYVAPQLESRLRDEKLARLQRGWRWEGRPVRPLSLERLAVTEKNTWIEMVVAEARPRADRRWLSRLITRHVPLARFVDAFERQPGDIKVITEFGDA